MKKKAYNEDKLKRKNKRKEIKIMKKKNVLKRLLCLMAVVALLTPSVVAFAESDGFDYHNYVYGSRYTVVLNGTALFSMSKLDVYITDIRTSSDESCNYKKVKADVLAPSGNQICVDTNYTLYKGKTTSMPLLVCYAQGTQMLLRMKGNKDNLDCQVYYRVFLEEIGAGEI